MSLSSGRRGNQQYAGAIIANGFYLDEMDVSKPGGKGKHGTEPK